MTAPFLEKNGPPETGHNGEPPPAPPEDSSGPLRPTLAVCLTAYAAGILGAPYFPFSLPLVLSPLLFPVLLLVPGLRLFRRQLLILFFVTLGLSLYHLDLRPPADPSHVSHFSGRGVGLQGQVSAVSPATDRTTFDLVVTDLFLSGRHVDARGKVRIYLRQATDDIVPGDLLRLRCRLRRPELFGTPGEFDYPRHLAGLGIRSVAFLPNSRQIAHLPTLQTLPFRVRIEKLRNFLGDFIDSAVPPEQAAYLRAILIGDRSGFTPADRELLSRLGLAHLFSVSGLHMGILFAVLYPLALFPLRRSETLLLRLGPPRRFLPLLLAPFLGFYLLVAGSGLPAQRAFWTILLAGTLVFLFRPGNPLAILAAAAFGILLWDPPALFSPSFQLSFAAVFAILHLAPAWLSRTSALPAVLRYPATIFLVTLCATAATFPLVLAHFHMASLAGLANNLFAVPLVAGIALPMAMAAALFIPLHPPTAGFLLGLSGRLIQETIALGEGLTRLLPGSDSRFYATPLQNLGIFLGFGLLLWQPWKRGRGKTALVLAVLSALLFFIPLNDGSSLTVTALSVGQGDAILVSRGQDHYLVDAGGFPVSDFDIGERILAPALGRLGVRRLKAVILTHPHPDHYLGMIHILRHFPVTEFWSALQPRDLPPPLYEILRERAIPVVVLPQGWSRRQSEGKEPLWLFVPGQESARVNDHSLACYCRCGEDGLLLTGDLEADGVQQLLEDFPPYPVTLLKLPHHGSPSSDPDRLLARLNPCQVFVSVGRNNPHGLPHPRTLAVVQERAIPLYRTDRDGSLRFRSEGSGWQTRHWERGLFR
jgi:competence protein ComEC